MLKLTKAFGNTGYEIGCWLIKSPRIFVDDDTADVEIRGYKSVDEAVAGHEIITEHVTLRGITAVLQGDGKTYIENLEAAIMQQIEGYDKAAVATTEEVTAAEAKIGK